MIELADNRYGKQRVRLLKVTREPHRNQVHEWTVSVLLRGNFVEAHTIGENRSILATDTMKNTVYWVARHSHASQPEEYAAELISYLLERNPQVDSVEVEVEAHLWKRLTIEGVPHPDTFMHGSAELQVARVEGSREKGFLVRAGFTGLHLLKTANSAFAGFIRDPLTSLPETEDRVFGTIVDAEWEYAPSAGPDYAMMRATTRETLLRTFANHHSRSVQQTLYAMAQEAFGAVPQIEQMRLTMPNKHCLLVDLARFGGDNPNQIFVPTDEPHGYIEARLRRSAR